MVAEGKTYVLQALGDRHPGCGAGRWCWRSTWSAMACAMSTRPTAATNLGVTKETLPSILLDVKN
jgi:hypothetical protein